jgi:thiol:disulfide interchange protein DsbA
MVSKTQQWKRGIVQCVVGLLAAVSLLACAADTTTPTASAAPAAPTTVATEFQSGVHYLQMDNLPLRAEKVKVVEFFSYACPHCYELENYIEPWIQKEQANIDFQRMPAAWNAYYEFLSQAFFTIQILKREDQLNAAMFNAIHRERLNLQSIDGLRTLFVREGVTADVFDKTFDSFAVKQKVFQAKSSFEKFHLSSVPSVVVADHYVTDVSKAGGHEKLLKLLSHLVALSQDKAKTAAK